MTLHIRTNTHRLNYLKENKDPAALFISNVMWRIYSGLRMDARDTQEAIHHKTNKNNVCFTARLNKRAGMCPSAGRRDSPLKDLRGLRRDLKAPENQTVGTFM